MDFILTDPGILVDCCNVLGIDDWAVCQPSAVITGVAKIGAEEQ
jgi:hypothetical protein